MNVSFRYLVLATLVSFVLPQRLEAQLGNDNPTGVTGDYNGSITTAGSYDPFTGNASRAVEDIVVAGSVGAYPLKWERRLNTRDTSHGFGMAGGWSHSYRWELLMYRPFEPGPTPPPGPTPGQEWEGPDGVINYPDGRTAEFYEPWNAGCCDAAEEGPFGMWDRLVDLGGGHRDLQLADGGVVKFDAPSATSIYYTAREIVDPYGKTTTLHHDSLGRLDKVIEPGGRYLEIYYTTFNLNPNGTAYFITRVEANDGLGHVTQTVNYHYEEMALTPGHPIWYLTSVDYDDQTHAYYQYQQSNCPALQPHDTGEVFQGLIWKCNDVRFAGPMKKIQYEFRPRAQWPGRVVWGEIWREKNEYGDVLSEVAVPIPTPGPGAEFSWREEHRPGGSTRQFHYHNRAYLDQYSDFLNQWAYNTISYDTGTGNSNCQFTNARGYMTEKRREPLFRATIRVTHPDPEHSYIETFYSDPARPHYVLSRTDERTNPTQYVRYLNDPNKNMIQQINYPDGSYEDFTYNEFGQVEDHTMTSGGVEHFRYTRGLKTFYWPPATSSDNDPGSHKTQYFYYDANNCGTNPNKIDRLWYVEDPLHHKTFYDYNKRGQVTLVTHHDNSYVQSHYNDDGTLDWTEDELTHRTTYVYDEYKRVTQLTRVVNGIAETTINDYIPPPINGVVLDRLSHTTASIYHTTSPMLKVAEYDYDLNFRRIRMTQAPGTSDEATTTFHYDPVGNVDWVEDPRIKRTTFHYDERNRQDSVKNVELNETTTVKYDAASNKIREQREQDGPFGTFRTWDHDSMNRLKHAYDWRTNEAPALNQTTTYDRDHAGNAHFITDTKGARYEFQYDELNRKTAAIYPHEAGVAAPTEAWRYDFAGNMDRYTNPAGQVRHFHYDNRNRQDHSWWDDNAGPDIATSYDAASRIWEILASSPAHIAMNGGMAPDAAHAETKIRFGYDAANRKTWEEQTLADHPTRHIQTDLDGDGRRMNLQLTDGEQGDIGAAVYSSGMQDSGTYFLQYEYTERSQLKNIHSADGAWAFDYTYDASGNMISREASSAHGPNSSTECLNDDYDALNRPRTWEQSGAGGSFALSHYQYDRANREQATWRDEENGRGERFTYEPTNQLKTAVYSALNVAGPSPSPSGAAHSVSYAYSPDKLNRLSVTDNGQVKNYSPNALNQYSSVGGESYQYDNDFNLTHTDGLNAVYDAANRLVAASNATGLMSLGPMAAEFVYDGLGRCVKRTFNGVETVLVYDGWKPIAEFDHWDAFQAYNVYGPGEDEILLRQGVKYGYTRFGLDRHGNVAFLVDDDGVMQEKYTYDAFGQPKITGAGGDIHAFSYFSHCFLFQGREYMYGLGIYDYRNRFYYPGLGRFLQTDPTGFAAGDMNLFRYCGDDPVDLSDPLGLYGEEIPNLEEAIHVARGRVMTEASSPTRPTKIVTLKTAGFPAGRTVRYTPGISVPVLKAKSGNYEIGKMVYGSVQQYGKDYYDVEPTREKGTVLPVHSHVDTRAPNGGLGSAGFSRLDRELPMVERMDESKPGWWHRGARQKDGSWIESKPQYDDGSRRTSGPNRSGPLSFGLVSEAAPSAADVDAAHQATGVPSLGAEAVNSAPGRP